MIRFWVDAHLTLGSKMEEYILLFEHLPLELKNLPKKIWNENYVSASALASEIMIYL